MATLLYQSLLSLSLWALVLCQDSASETILSYTMAEENTPNYVIGNVAIDAGLGVKHGVDALQEMQFSFLSQSSQYASLFKIGENNGVLEAVETIDRDEICPNMVVCSIPLDITVQPGQYFEIIKVAVTVQDINDNAPEFPEPEIDRYLSEASMPGSSITIAAAEDPDSPPYNIQQYLLTSSQDTFDLNIRNNSDGSVDIRLILKTELNHEDIASYEATVVAFDGDTPPKTGSVVVSIEVLDVNDNNPIFTNQTYEASVYENVPKYTTIVKVHADDLDSGPNGEVVYGFSTKTERAYGELFAIDPVTGEIYNKEIMDYESGAVYNLDVTAVDKSPDALPSVAKVIIHIKDLNDHAPQITVNQNPSGLVQISEYASVGDFVAHISVKDPDGGNNGQFNCSLDDSTHFLLNQLYPTEFKIVTNTEFDREVESQYELALVCQDKGSPPQATTQIITVEIRDENDHKPTFTKEFYETNMFENNTIGQFVEQVTAIDLDAGDNAKITYKLVGDANDKFNIDPETGEITAKIIFDHEKETLHSFIVNATDHGDPPEYSTTTVILKIEDIDDEAPKFSQETYSFTVMENQPINTYVDQINATDPDSEPYNHFTFTLDPRYNVEEAFHIEGTSGRIFTRKTLDREQQRVYHLLIKATSIGSPYLTSSAHVFVQVGDENDNGPNITYPNTYNNTVYIKEDAPKGFVIARIVASDDDSGENAKLTYSISPVDGENLFTVDQSTAAILVDGSLRGQSEHMLTLFITVQDNGLPVKTAEAMLNIVVNKSADYPSTAAPMSNQNFTIVVSIASISGVLMIILIAAIIVILYKQRKKKKVPTATLR